MLKIDNNAIQMSGQPDKIVYELTILTHAVANILCKKIPEIETDTVLEGIMLGVKDLEKNRGNILQKTNNIFDDKTEIEFLQKIKELQKGNHKNFIKVDEIRNTAKPKINSKFSVDGFILDPRLDMGEFDE